MEDNKIRVGITQGDINGVGSEVMLKTFQYRQLCLRSGSQSLECSELHG